MDTDAPEKRWDRWAPCDDALLDASETADAPEQRWSQNKGPCDCRREGREPAEALGLREPRGEGSADTEARRGDTEACLETWIE